jgi:hypothetical protein
VDFKGCSGRNSLIVWFRSAVEIVRKHPKSDPAMQEAFKNFSEAVEAV